ncbi:MAG TPA: hypothetical protein VLB80_01245 [Candidatus Babeliales bacterium]|nr:hypothetical protein [Candidatus Babeliales bacterium]
MNKYHIQFVLFVWFISYYGIYGMEKNITPVRNALAVNVLQQLLFDKNNKILNIGGYCREIIKAQVADENICCIDIDRFYSFHGAALDWNKVTSFFCWDIVKQPLKTFEISAKFLCSKGQFCALIPHYTSPYLKVHYEVLMRDIWKKYCKNDTVAMLYGSKKMKQFLVMSGLGTNATCTIIRDPFIFETEEKFRQWIVSSPEQLHDIPTGLHEVFIKDIIDVYLRYYPLREDGSVELYFTYMIVSGYKD